MEKRYLTKESYEELLRDLEQCKFETRKKISELIRRAKEDGDLSENAAYEEARKQESFNEARIEQLESILRDSEIVESPHLKNVIEIGDNIKLSGGLSFTLVGSQQASPPKKISIESPLGKTLLGKKLGDSVTIKTPSGQTKQYKILEVE